MAASSYFTTLFLGLRQLIPTLRHCPSVCGMFPIVYDIVLHFMAGFLIFMTLSLDLWQVFMTDAIKTHPSWHWLDYWAASLGAPLRSHLPRVRVPTWRRTRLPRPCLHPRAATPQAVFTSGRLAWGGGHEGALTLPSPGTEGAHGCEAEARGREAWAGIGWSGSPDGSLPSSLS